MAPFDGKRPVPAKVAAMQARKRRKLEGRNDWSKFASQKSKAQKGPVKIDALGWKAVSMPDKLDDYEGFLGLEEVEDVEIVKNDSTGKVTYVASSRGNGHLSPRTAETIVDDHDNGHDEEWNGFGDDGDSDRRDDNDPGGQLDERSGKQKTKKKLTKKAEKSKANQANGQSGIFDSLDEENGTEGVDVSAWEELHLSPDTLASLSRLRFVAPTLIQKAAISDILSGHDVIGKASTGSGKTLAFGIPILERFLELRTTAPKEKPEEKIPLALILLPTRELAHQIAKHLDALCSNGLFDGPSIATLTGGLSVQKQQRLLKHADIIIGTPGRLWEVVSGGQGLLSALKKIQYLVVDEADRLLSEGHFQEVEEILNALERTAAEDDETEQAAEVNNEVTPRESIRQTLVFSATFDRSLQTRLATRQKISRTKKDNLLDNRESMEYLLSKLPFKGERPKSIDVNPVNQLATGLKEGLIECAGSEKDLYLYTILLLHSNARTLVFTNSISAVRRITPFLQNLGLNALALHSGMPQKARLRSVERFTTAKATIKGSILVATDVAARGLDIPNVQLVVHYHLPRAADTYVHRSGRTARAGAPGSSILICGPEEVVGVRRLIAKVHAQSAVLNGASEAKKQGYYIRTLDLDRRLVTRLKPRAQLAKKLADTAIAKEKSHKETDFFRSAAEELGVDYDSEELEKTDSGKRGRGSGRKQKEREARSLTKAEVGAIKAELKALLQQRVNVGVSEMYLTSGNVDVDQLLKQQEAGNGRTGEFLGRVDGVGLDDL